MQRALVVVKEHNGQVELHVTTEGEPMVIVLDGRTARKIGDELYRAGCSSCL